MTEFRVNPERRLNVARVGRANLPVLCIDDCFAEPEALVALACEAMFIDAGPGFPGLRAPAPEGYVQTMLTELARDISEHFGVPPEPDLELCAYSMVSTPPSALRVVQRIPHFDGPEPRRIAFLHYLCQPEQGGTSFYRHRSSGLECLAPHTVDGYRQTIMSELEVCELPVGYALRDTPLFERIHRVDAAFNRLIVYHGSALHSGDIGSGTVLCEDPRIGRLTINGFGFLQS